MINKNNGFSLIEVLIALVVLSIGLLGVASLQTKSQQFNRGAYLHTQATVFAHDILERARANPQGNASSSYNKPNNQEHTTCYSSPGCSPQEIAENDMFEWSESIKSSLPGGKSIICIDSSHDDGTPAAPACDGAGVVYAAKVWWIKPDSSYQRVEITTGL